MAPLNLLTALRMDQEPYVILSKNMEQLYRKGKENCITEIYEKIRAKERNLFCTIKRLPIKIGQ